MSVRFCGDGYTRDEPPAYEPERLHGRYTRVCDLPSRPCALWHPTTRTSNPVQVLAPTQAGSLEPPSRLPRQVLASTQVLAPGPFSSSGFSSNAVSARAQPSSFFNNVRQMFRRQPNPARHLGRSIGHARLALDAIERAGPSADVEPFIDELEIIVGEMRRANG